MPDMNEDIPALFAEREADRYAHAYPPSQRADGPGAARPSATMSAFCRGSGQYLYDREGTRYLDLLSGFGVFAIGPQPSGPARSAEERSRQRASQPRADGRLDAGRRSGRAPARACALSRQGVLRQFGRRGGRGRHQVRPRRHRPSGHRLLRPRVSTASPMARCRSTATTIFRERLRAAAAGLREHSRSTTSRRSNGALHARDVAAFIVEPIQGKGVNLPSDDYLEAPPQLVPPARHAVRRRRDPDRPRPHRQISGDRALGRRARHGAASPRRCPAATCRSAPC